MPPIEANFAYPSGSSLLAQRFAEMAETVKRLCATGLATRTKLADETGRVGSGGGWTIAAHGRVDPSSRRPDPATPRRQKYGPGATPGGVVARRPSPDRSPRTGSANRSSSATRPAGRQPRRGHRRPQHLSKGTCPTPPLEPAIQGIKRLTGPHRGPRPQTGATANTASRTTCALPACACRAPHQGPTAKRRQVENRRASREWCDGEPVAKDGSSPSNGTSDCRGPDSTDRAAKAPGAAMAFRPQPPS